MFSVTPVVSSICVVAQMLLFLECAVCIEAGVSAEVQWVRDVTLYGRQGVSRGETPVPCWVFTDR